MVFVIINTDVEGLFHPYTMPAGTCIRFASDGGVFFLPLNFKTQANTHVSLDFFNYFTALLHVEGMEQRFLLLGGLGKTWFQGVWGVCVPVSHRQPVRKKPFSPRDWCSILPLFKALSQYSDCDSNGDI